LASPYHIRGLRIVHTILKPTVVDFLVLTTKTGNMKIQIEEVLVEKGSLLAESTIREADNRAKLVVMIVALKRRGEKILFNTNADTRIEVGDRVVVIGEPEHFNQLERMVRGKRVSGRSDETITDHV